MPVPSTINNVASTGLDWLTNLQLQVLHYACTKPAKIKYDLFSNMEHSKSQDSTRAKDALTRSRELIYTAGSDHKQLSPVLVSNQLEKTFLTDQRRASIWPDTKVTSNFKIGPSHQSIHVPNLRTRGSKSRFTI